MKYYTIIAADVGDLTSNICVMTKKGDKRQILEETIISTTPAGVELYFKSKPRSMGVVFEAGAHCRWMSPLLEKLGFRIYIADPSKLPTISRSNTKNDRNDAKKLAQLALADPELLHPIKLRSEVCQDLLRLEEERNDMIECRTKITNTIRGFAKAKGMRLTMSDCLPSNYIYIDKRHWDPQLLNQFAVFMPVLKGIEEGIKKCDREIKATLQMEPFKKLADIALEVYGAGIHIVATFLAVLDCDVLRFKKARDVGPFLGLVPRQDQSGQIDKQLHTTKVGNKLLRKHLIEGANVILRQNARDTDLKLRGLRMCMRGGKIAKSKALTAVARGLAVTIVARLMHPEREYVMLSESAKQEFAQLREVEQYRQMANHLEKEVQEDASEEEFTQG